MMEGGINCVVLLGPTAVGKTALGVRLARRYGWDIVSADSRQVYRGLDIGSGKDLADYTVEETGPDGSVSTYTVPHHLIDVATLDVEYNVFNFQQQFYGIMNSKVARGET
ncbi:MAG: tRNA (adenosine(37)-N6)-dimethylallyltransferase MiaA, partial [Treponema sp.]|nr:tRNA (adenosine(37)-N6)-dimethylallyltransferase MiaA [Treponema sp.]